ncbi:MAG: hypothetical protein ACFFA0_02410 [Promethearchaeota archaeon]
MIKNTIVSKLRKKLKYPVIITSIFCLTLLADSFFQFNLEHNHYDYNGINSEERIFNENIKNANGDSFLFQGIEQPLIINDTGILYELNQEITISNQEELNLSYYLDETNNWKAERVETTVNNIHDTRNWINNSGFQPVQIFRKYQTFESNSGTHPYDNNQNAYSDIEYTIIESGAYYMRVHFVNMSFDYQTDASDSDFMLIMNGSGCEVFAASRNRSDFYSPWSIGDTMTLSYDSDLSPITVDYGYYIDYYEILNASSNLEVNSVNWKGRYVQSGSYGSNTYGFGNITGNNAMFIGYHGSWYPGSDLETFAFYESTFTEVYQEDIVVPRGKVIDAYLSFDYYGQFALETNNIILYMNINGEKVYSKGLLDLSAEGKNIWHHTGKVPMYLWINQTNVFNLGNLMDQTLNISIGLRNAGASTGYSGYDDGNANLVWLDNITLSITTIANATQDSINLTIDDINFEPQNEWGKATLNLTKGWGTNPIILTVNTTSPDLTFDLNTTVYGYHETLSSYNQLYDQGVSYEILENGTIYWELNHYLYMPFPYKDFEFEIEKPVNWEFLTVLDPFLQTRYFEKGKLGDNYILINKSNTLFAGWYTLTATSPNYFNSSNIKIFKQNQWVQNASFSTGESTQITAQLDYMGEIPNDVGYINLTIYHPNGTIFYEENISPSNGNVTFSQITFGAFNTSGGIYEYTLFWSNGTALGGIKSNFIVNHQSSLTLLKPDDAKIDNTTGAIAGDIIPLRIYLTDAENNLYISNASVSYNWTTGTQYFIEAALGIYEAILDTSYLGGYGLYNIVINSSKLGFISSNLTLMINLGENTNLQRLDSDSKIIIHENSTIRFFYYSEFDDEGISGAEVFINISNSDYYTIRDLSEGIYSIEFSTVFINNTGIYRLIFEFSSIGYEPQIHIYQFEIIDPPVIPEEPNILLWVILFVSIGISTVFAALSLRSYVLLPRKRKKEALLISKTQRFKDLRNIQAIVIVHKLSGIPLYSKSYSILEKHKKELFSGFIQAITTMGEEFSQQETDSLESNSLVKKYGTEKILELDFKYFYCLIADQGDVRAIFVLKERSSERLKSQVSNMILALNLKLSKEIENWDGSLDKFEVLIPNIIKEYFELHYKGSFGLSAKIDILKLRKERSLTKLEIRVLNVIKSISNRNNNIVNLDNVIELVSEENKDLIIEAIEVLIENKLIMPINP